MERILSGFGSVLMMSISDSSSSRVKSALQQIACSMMEIPEAGREGVVLEAFEHG